MFERVHGNQYRAQIIIIIYYCYSVVWTKFSNLFLHSIHINLYSHQTTKISRHKHSIFECWSKLILVPNETNQKPTEYFNIDTAQNHIRVYLAAG